MLNWMQSLSDGTRVRLLRLLERHELTVAELCAVLQSPQSTVSRHLKVLADDGWIDSRREATSRLYHMSLDDLEPPARRLWLLLREQTADLPSSEQDEQRLASVLADRQSRSQAFFSSAAGQWDRLRHELYGDRFDAFAFAGLLGANWVVGDLGCGTGQTAEAVAPFVSRVIAVDQAAGMISRARQRLGGAENVELRRGELEALPLDDGELDAAVIILVLHHVADPPAVLVEAARVLRPGGHLLVVDMTAHERTEYRQQMGHVWLGFEPKQVVAWLGTAGFTDTRIRLLPTEAQARGPALFAAAASRTTGTSNPPKRSLS